MNVDELIKDLQKRLESFQVAIVARNARRIYVDVPPEFSREANRILFEEFDGRLATATGMDTPDRIEVLYHYGLDRDGLVVTLRTGTAKPDCVLDSIATFLPGANFIEREIQDLLGVRFQGHPDPRRLILADHWPPGVYPLRRDYPLRRQRQETPEFLRELREEATTP
jgi:Ni,Fe-hydrogenase III component G